jgi:hypothetical protein
MVSELESEAFCSVKNKRTISGASAMRIRHSGGGSSCWLPLYPTPTIWVSLFFFFRVVWWAGGRPLIIIVGFDRLVVLSRYRPAERTFFLKKRRKSFFFFFIVMLLARRLTSAQTLTGAFVDR